MAGKRRSATQTPPPSIPVDRLPAWVVVGARARETQLKPALRRVLDAYEYFAGNGSGCEARDARRLGFGEPRLARARVSSDAIGNIAGMSGSRARDYAKALVGVGWLRQLAPGGRGGTPYMRTAPLHLITCAMDVSRRAYARAATEKRSPHPSTFSVNSKPKTAPPIRARSEKSVRSAPENAHPVRAHTYTHTDDDEGRAEIDTYLVDEIAATVGNPYRSAEIRNPTGYIYGCLKRAALPTDAQTVQRYRVAVQQHIAAHRQLSERDNHDKNPQHRRRHAAPARRNQHSQVMSRLARLIDEPETETIC